MLRKSLFYVGNQLYKHKKKTNKPFTSKHFYNAHSISKSREAGAF